MKTEIAKEGVAWMLRKISTFSVRTTQLHHLISSLFVCVCVCVCVKSPELNVFNERPTHQSTEKRKGHFLISAP